MSDIFTRADAVREYLTGAASDGAVQNDPTLSLGGFRASKEALSIGFRVYNPIDGVKIEAVSGANPIGDGVLTVTTNSISWAPNGEDSGSAVTFSGTQTKIVEGDNPVQFLRITGSQPFSPGSITLRLFNLVNNVFGFSDILDALATSGGAKYRATILRNESSGSLTNVKRFLGTLGTTQVSDSAQLGGSGSGTITTTGSFADWPKAGWCRIEQSGGTLREIVYYTSRTNTSLTVPSAGRSRLGTSAAAGAGTDNIYPVPGIAIAKAVDGVQAFGDDIATIANENTAPAGVTWNTGITTAGGLSIGTLATTEQIGLWIWQDIPAGMIFDAQKLNKILTNFDV